MTILLDENFPLALLRGLRADGATVDHIITLGWRGTSDDEHLQECLLDFELLFLTEDEDYLFSMQVAAVIVLSRVRQERPLRERVDVCRQAIQQLIQSARPERRFELMDDGSLVPWAPGPGNTWIAKPPQPRGGPPIDAAT